MSRRRLAAAFLPLLLASATQGPLAHGPRPNALERTTGWRDPFAESDAPGGRARAIDGELVVPGSYGDFELELVLGGGGEVSLQLADGALGSPVSTLRETGARLARWVVRGTRWQRLVGAQREEGETSAPAGGGATLTLRATGQVVVEDLVVRHRADLPGKRVELYDGVSLAGWRALGDARYTAEPDGILGTVLGGSQSFLITERTFGDFLLEVDVRAEQRGNSGLQLRSHLREDGSLFGYQVEVDPSERAWSGGLYDEARRGWLQDLADNAAGRAAFRYGQWNRYRVACLGPWLRVWLNGVATVDTLDPLDLEGVLGLQVHNGRDTRVRFGNFALRDLGARRWEPFAGDVAGWERASQAGPAGERATWTWHARERATWPLGTRDFGSWRLTCADGGLVRLVAFERTPEAPAYELELVGEAPEPAGVAREVEFVVTSLGERLAVHRAGRLWVDLAVPAEHWALLARPGTSLHSLARVGACRGPD